MDYDKEFKTAIAAMRPEYAHCRDYGHDWRPYDVREAGRNYERILRCSRCETLRHQHIAKKGGRYVGGMLGNRRGQAEKGSAPSPPTTAGWSGSRPSRTTS